ncbi:MAG: acyltransferase [Spirochaetes bacterium]|nr:acyltransferase [Spirochaetota bacterium]
MKRTLPSTTIGAVSICILAVNTLFWACFLFPVALVKLLVPLGPVKRLCNRVLNGIAFAWIAGNNGGLSLTRKIDWQVQLPETLRRDRWYLVISNHQSWTDIVVLQRIFHGRIPFLKFFLKKELIWVPVLGLAWWALEFPFMKRYSRSFLERHPHLKGKDIEITKRACARFATMPVSVMNFVEGTRFNEGKRLRQESPYRSLLRPKSGGVGFVFSAMGGILTSVLNVTIVYPGGPYTFWDFACGRVREIRVDVEEIPVTDDIAGDYIDDPVYRGRFQEWLNRLWEEKDLKIDLMLDRPAGGAPAMASWQGDEKKTDAPALQ